MLLEGAGRPPAAIAALGTEPSPGRKTSRLSPLWVGQALWRHLQEARTWLTEGTRCKTKRIYG